MQRESESESVSLKSQLQEMFPEQIQGNIDYALLHRRQDLAWAVDYLLNGGMNNTGQSLKPSEWLEYLDLALYL